MISLQELSSEEWNDQRVRLEEAAMAAITQLMRHTGGACEVTLRGEHYHAKIICVKPERPNG